MAHAQLHLSQNAEADELLSDDPLALLVGMVLDQQVPLEWAFSAPLVLLQRLGRPLDAAELAAMDPDELVAIFSEKPAMHRYPGSMAKRVHELCRTLVDDYGGRAERVWDRPESGAELLARLRALPGFGEQKAKIFVALLAKQLGVRPPGWEEVSAPFGEPDSHRSVADIVDEASLAKVRAFKQDMKAKAKAKAASAR
ncbi:MAG TPA: HhH-GPD-type base excision DNA repair protein [Acidimicrobiales bacterium]|nr:HhH-GPD-type base excision DNA repair protein [Acidimicrobiales bacterium]